MTGKRKRPDTAVITCSSVRSFRCTTVSQSETADSFESARIAATVPGDSDGSIVGTSHSSVKFMPTLYEGRWCHRADRRTDGLTPALESRPGPAAPSTCPSVRLSVCPSARLPACPAAPLPALQRPPPLPAHVHRDAEFAGA